MMVVTCCVFPMIRIMIKRIVKLVTGQFPLAVEQNVSADVTMDQTYNSHTYDLPDVQHNQEYEIPLVNQSHDEYVPMSQVNEMLWNQQNDRP